MGHETKTSPTNRLLLEAIRPIYGLCNPLIEGMEHLDAKKPSLFVANHTTLGVLDIPLFYFALHEQAGIRLRGLAHHIFFKTTATARVLHAIGAVEGTRENCTRLMEEGEHILVFPGGGPEVCKTKEQKYQLLWRERLGFVKMAVSHGYPIVPLASVGAEEVYDIKYDRNDLLRSPIGSILKKLAPRLDEIPPIVTGWKGTLLPKPERFYFKFMPPIATSGVSAGDEEACQAIKARTQHAIETAIGQLLEIREKDPQRHAIGLRNLRRTGG